MQSRTTLRIDHKLMRDAKALAAREGRTLTAVVEDALREVLGAKATRMSKRRKLKRLPTFGQGGLKPGVDLTNSRKLLDLLDESLELGPAEGK